jgi:hypothetical protein
MDFPTSSKRKPQQRYGKLDGRPLPKPRGRHATPRSDDDPVRKVVTIPMDQRLGYRPAEFAALTGLSYPTIWRRIKSGQIKAVEIGGVKLVPRAFAIECGLITDDARV